MKREERKAIVEARIAMMRENPQLTKITRQVEARRVENTVTEIKVGDHVLISDAARSMGGTERGPGGATFVLAGLAACTLGSIALSGTLRGIPIDSVEVSVTADIDLRGSLGLEEGVPVGYTNIRYEAKIKSSASEKEIRELTAIAERRCPAYDTLIRPQKIEGKVLLNGRPLS